MAMSKRVSVLLQNSNIRKEKKIKKEKSNAQKTNIPYIMIHISVHIRIKKAKKHWYPSLILPYQRTKSKLFLKKSNPHEDLRESHTRFIYFRIFFLSYRPNVPFSSNPALVSSHFLENC